MRTKTKFLGVAVANYSGAMEPETIKNGASLKSLITSRGNQTCIRITVFLMAAVFLFSSCATIVSKSAYPLAINSTPSNANISITNKKNKEVFLGNTPAVVKLRAGSGFFSKAAYQVKFSSPGYETKTVPVTFTLDGWYFGNIFFGGLPGMLLIDPATGAMWKIETDILNETLIQAPTNATIVNTPVTGRATITGVVTESSGETISGVSIVLKGTNSGTFSSVKGEYSITVPNNEAILVFAKNGFQTQEIVVGEQREIKVTIEEVRSRRNTR